MIFLFSFWAEFSLYILNAQKRGEARRMATLIQRLMMRLLGPLILLVMLLPVTFNGIGTSQAAFVWFFGRAGVAAPVAFALSVLFVALGVVGNLPGGFLYASGRQRR